MDDNTLGGPNRVASNAKQTAIDESVSLLVDLHVKNADLIRSLSNARTRLVGEDALGEAQQVPALQEGDLLALRDTIKALHDQQITLASLRDFFVEL